MMVGIRELSSPTRLQLSRRKGFDLQALSQASNGLPAVKVDRSTGFGNPFPVTKAEALSSGVPRPIWCVGSWNGPAMWFRDTPEEAAALSVESFRTWMAAAGQAPLVERAKAELRGKNLACWCKAGSPCHADVLLELANRPICEAVEGSGQTLADAHSKNPPEAAEKSGEHETEARRFLARFVARGWLSANRECIEEQYAVDLGLRRRWLRTEMSEAHFTPAGRRALDEATHDR